MRKMIFSTMPFDYFEQHRSGALYDKETYFLNFINSAYHYALLLGVFGLAIGLVIVGYFFPFGTNKTLTHLLTVMLRIWEHQVLLRE